MATSMHRPSAECLRDVESTRRNRVGDTSLTTTFALDSTLRRSNKLGMYAPFHLHLVT
jgi:hypothetical protein